ncbi:MAG: hypothetical protein D6731_23020 [Planctomycetota bacterium]|nr:MAG: hypothetical protein D6731_23020 [Planctomycetota bacterium]
MPRPRRTRLFLSAVLAATSAGLAMAGGEPLVVEGEVHLHGASATLAEEVEPLAGAVTGERYATPIPRFDYAPPETTVSEPGPLTPRTLDGAGEGASVVYEFDGGRLGADSLLVARGGGIVGVRVRGDLTLDHVRVEVREGTRLVFFVDGDLVSRWSEFVATGGGSVQLQAAGRVEFYAESFVGVAFANRELTLDTAGEDMRDRIVMDDALLSAPVEGGQRRLRLLPLVEGDL